MGYFTTTVTYEERFFHSGDVTRDICQPREGYQTYGEAVDAAARLGLPHFDIRKTYVRVDGAPQDAEPEEDPF